MPSKRQKQRRKKQAREAAPVAPRATITERARKAVRVERREAKKVKVASVVTDPLAPYFERWKAGETIHALATASGVKRSRLRRSLITLAGGRPGFRELRAQGAGGRAKPFGGKRGGGRTRAAVTLDDSNVPMVTSTSTRDGWRHRHIYSADGSITVATSPDGVEYVQAGPTERADLIRIIPIPGLPNVRLRRYEGSGIAKRQSKTERTLERGEAGLERAGEAKRERRARRRARRNGKWTGDGAAPSAQEVKRLSRAVEAAADEAAERRTKPGARSRAAEARAAGRAIVDAAAAWDEPATTLKRRAAR